MHLKDKNVVWFLFDDANSSCFKTLQKYKNELEKFKIEAYSIGINDKELNYYKENNITWHYKKIDLRLTNPTLIKELKKLPSPDIVFAFPPCESFSIADCAGVMVQKYDARKWDVKSKKFYENYNVHATPYKKRSFIQKETSRLNGEACAGAVVHIINTFAPQYWVIENPRKSRIWEFYDNHWDFRGEENKVNYYCYDAIFSKKPTTFLSNKY